MTLDGRPLLLIVEDNDEDYETTLRVLRKSSVERHIHRCVHGDDALDFLYKREKYADLNIKRPAVILLDLNLPGTDGREVLQAIKQHDTLKSIPVVILSTSSNPIDIETSYHNGANSYLVKPVDFSGFVHAMQSFDDYWFRVVVLSHV
jgi:CheY-like chemotaxis protein